MDIKQANQHVVEILTDLTDAEIQLEISALRAALELRQQWDQLDEDARDRLWEVAQ